MPPRIQTRSVRRRAPRRLQLKKLTISGVRSIQHQAIDLKPLTVVVGGNSAGKSTVLKSILLLVQAQRDSINPGDVGLNGNLVNLDKFDSVINSRMKNRSAMTIGMEFGLSDEGSRAPFQYLANAPGRSRVAVSLDSEIEDYLLFEVEMGEHPRTKGSAEIEVLKLDTVGGGLRLSRAPNADWPINADESTVVLNFAGDFNFDSRDDIDFYKVSGVVLDGIVPRRVAFRRTIAETLIEELLTQWGSQRRFGNRSRHSSRGVFGSLCPEFVDFEPQIRDEEIVVRTTERTLLLLKEQFEHANGLAEVLEAFIKVYLIIAGPEPILEQLDQVQLSSVREYICGDIEILWMALVGAHRLSLDGLSPELVQSVGQRVRDEIEFVVSQNPKERTEPYLANLNLLRRAAMSIFRIGEHWPIVDLLEQIDGRWRREITILQDEPIDGSAELTEFLTNQVHYVGPLRRGPETVTGYRMRGSVNQVGPEGENLAYLLSLNPIVKCPMWTGKSGVSEIEVKETTLQQAISYWVRELSLADEVSAREEPGIGDMIKLKMRGVDAELSPNDVGVGVSQALPVIAAVLMARPDDLIVLEQPELHLHPNAQLGLTDFFIAAARSGRRLLIESHSEHFLARMRLRSVETADDDHGWIAQNAGFIFAESEEPDSETGATFRQVDISVNGEIEDWPRGFFDQGPRESRTLFLRQQTKDA